jgi:hypothetical protein
MKDEKKKKLSHKLFSFPFTRKNKMVTHSFNMELIVANIAIADDDNR